MKQETTTTTTTTTTPTATPTATPTTTPKKATTRKAVLLVNSRNTTARKDAKQATVDALRKLYANDHLSALSRCNFKDNRNETATLSDFTYTRETINSADEIETETATGTIVFDFFFFAPRENRTTAKKHLSAIGRTATATADDPTRADGEKHLNDAREIVRLAGFGNIADSVNPDTVRRMMVDGRFTTARGNRQFDDATTASGRALLSLFGWMVSVARQTPTDSAYARQQDEKARRQEQRKKEQDAKREQAKRDREQAKKNSAKQPAKKATAKKATTPAK